MSETPSWWRDEPLRFSPILEAAIEEFGAKGYHGTPVRDIARRVGVTVPALYYHHANKEAILLALLDGVTRDFADRAREADADAGDDPVRRLQQVVESIASGMTSRPELAALQSELGYLSGENRERQTAVRDEIEDVLTGVVADGVATGDFVVDDLAETVRAVLGMLQWIPTWYQPGGASSPADIAERYARLATRLVGVNDRSRR